MKEEKSKTELTTKEWLKRAYNIDRQIKSKLELIEMWKDLAGKCTASYTELTKNKSINGYKYFAMIADAEAEVEQDTIKLIAIKKEVSTAINKVLSPTSRVLLEQRYLLCQTWDRIADILGYSSEHTRKRIHPQALRAVEPFIKDDRICP